MKVWDAIVVGGGLAGISAACQLADAGLSVALVEGREILGGRASALTLPTSQVVDTGQHIFLGCCAQYMDLMTLLGRASHLHLQPLVDIPVGQKTSKGTVQWGRLRASRLPAPFHMLPGFIRYSHLTAVEKLGIARTLQLVRHADRTDPVLERQSFGQWLRQTGESEKVRRDFWQFFALPALNAPLDDVSAEVGIMLFQETILGPPQAAAVGLMDTNLGTLVDEPVRKYLARRNGHVYSRTQARHFLIEGHRVEGIQTQRGPLHSNKVVSALPPRRLQKLLPNPWVGHSPFRQLRQLQWAPIIDVHLEYDRPVMTDSFCAFLGSPVQWVFNQTRIWNQETGDSHGQVLIISLSHAFQWQRMSDADIKQVFAQEIEGLFPRAAKARLVSSGVLKQRYATFVPAPDSRHLRPQTQTPITGLYLSGDWTDTGWPATMEGAIISGRKAAAALIGERNG